MPAIPKIDENHLEAMCAIIADTSSGLTGSEIGRLLSRSRIEDPEPAITKRRRLFAALQAKQTKDGCANNVVAFIHTFMEPVRFVAMPQEFERFRTELNEVLAFSGLNISEDGKLKLVMQARTLTEAQERASRLKSELMRRKMHPDVLQFCKAELLQENYFHAVFEATKSVAQKIRDKTGLTGDGAEIVDKAFGISTPLLAINTLRTETEQTEQKGFANLLKGMFGTFRNPTAHAPKIYWPMKEEDALDLLSMVSYFHRRLDAAVSVGHLYVRVSTP